MAGFRTQYTRLNSNSEDPEEDLPPQGFDIAARGFEEVEKGICIFLQYSMYISLCICLPFFCHRLFFRREALHDILDIRNTSSYYLCLFKI